MGAGRHGASRLRAGHQACRGGAVRARHAPRRDRADACAFRSRGQHRPARARLERSGARASARDAVPDRRVGLSAAGPDHRRRDRLAVARIPARRPRAGGGAVRVVGGYDPGTARLAVAPYAGPYPGPCLALPTPRRHADRGRRLRDDEHGFMGRARAPHARAVQSPRSVDDGLGRGAAQRREPRGAGAARGGGGTRPADRGGRRSRRAGPLRAPLRTTGARPLHGGARRRGRNGRRVAAAARPRSVPETGRGRRDGDRRHARASSPRRGAGAPPKTATGPRAARTASRSAA